MEDLLEQRDLFGLFVILRGAIKVIYRKAIATGIRFILFALLLLRKSGFIRIAVIVRKREVTSDLWMLNSCLPLTRDPAYGDDVGDNATLNEEGRGLKSLQRSGLREAGARAIGLGECLGHNGLILKLAVRWVY